MCLIGEMLAVVKNTEDSLTVNKSSVSGSKNVKPTGAVCKVTA